jgi:hypothetical protein
VRKVAPLSTWPSRMAKVISPMPSEQQEAMGCPEVDWFFWTGPIVNL